MDVHTVVVVTIVAALAGIFGGFFAHRTLDMTQKANSGSGY